MKVLFVLRRNSKFGISPIILRQGESLKKAGIDLSYFLITGKSWIAYIKGIFILRKYLKNNNFNIVHAHFSYSALAASLAGASPLVVSLMGWNIQIWYLKRLILIFNKLFWDVCIVKSKKMHNVIKSINPLIIPNGVDLQTFHPIDNKIAQEKIGWATDKKHILFAANPKRPIKNFDLTTRAIDLLKRSDLELHVLDNVDPSLMVYYYNSADVVVLSSIAEGSPNVIKEAMACNIPIVSTDVGDVKERFDNVEGCFLSSFDPVDFANSITQALNYGKRTNSRSAVLSIEESTVAQKIKEVYISVLNTYKPNVNK